MAPIEPFARAPASILVLSDERLLLPETEGVWIHVVRATGEGITRIGGPSPTALDLPGAGPGRFRSLSALTLLADGSVLAGDRTAGVVSVFGPQLEPEGTFTLPETRSVWDLETLPDGTTAAAISPRHPTGGGQVALFTLRDGVPDSLRLRLPPELIFRANRWGAVASARLESTPGGRLFAYWTTFPWARSLDAEGDSLPRVGRFSDRYVPPSSGPSESASLARLRRWYASFTPLVSVESAGPLLAFEFLEATSERERTSATRRGGAADDERSEDGPSSSPAAGGAPAASSGTPAEPRSSFLNLYDADGRVVAADVPLPPGARLLSSNDAARLYVVTSARPRQMDIEVWGPRARR